MPTYRAVVEYDGTNFHGLQFQSDVRTVAGELERVLSALFAEPIAISSAGRTDAGVHASGQVISFRTARAFPRDRLALALNGNLPRDVSVRHAALVEDGFSARFDAQARAYEYRIINRPMPSALERRFAHHVHRPLDLDRARHAAAALIGEHDFVAFCGVLPERGGTVRQIHSIDITRSNDRVVVRLTGSGFLHRMVRITVGTLVEIAAGRRDPGDIPAILASKDRRRAGYTAPACGLTLVGVRYPGFDSEEAGRN
ncbi:MAG: tRNA pseudouridine(38-40) synthase TruA [Candidatus Lustribacter sp.]